LEQDELKYASTLEQKLNQGTATTAYRNHVTARQRAEYQPLKGVDGITPQEAIAASDGLTAG
jgi:hypothetical protein